MVGERNTVYVLGSKVLCRDECGGSQLAMRPDCHSCGSLRAYGIRGSFPANLALVVNASIGRTVLEVRTAWL